ncbi:hypothetical protein FisN_17Hh246 [Fistulifera solaris]|uniref:Endothelin-converting enzyme 1 n=1 Tax=Fistulifera solaris TaxID=1519565 RepID=A0A1Z5JH27_FISSO|nr:hypothetical protein FisN_17Hh246 [Fistulifera solaris]|eukprot:GAX13305.1 hypothetical protein FisN_17Hh246 [Fistulifera solaris]
MSLSTEQPMKCPCCSNPWSTTGEFALFCGVCETGKGLSRSNMELSVDPTVNFYRYANGGWMEKNPIPPEYPAWNTFLALHTTSQERCKDLLQELQQKEQHDDENARKLAIFYTAAMDEAKIEALGVQPLEPVMQMIQAAVAALRNGDIAEYSKLLGTFPAKYGIYPFFNTSASPDAKNASHTLCNFSQGGLGSGACDGFGTKNRSGVTRTENRDPDATYNKMTITQLMEGAQEKAEGMLLDFGSYLEGSTGKPAADLGSINVRNVAALHCVGDLAVTTSPGIIESYLKWHTITSCAPYLSSTFVQENFNFFEKALSGTQEMKPRWKRAMAFTEKALGEALGQIYCKRYFDESSKTQALKIVEAVRQALEARLNEVEWMKSATTREQALKKMSRFHVKIGYPNKWIDYTNLKITESDDFMTMIFQSRAFEHAREVDEMNAPTDREKWFMTPQTVNAYYPPSLNEIVFPAAILQPPFFDSNADDSVNFGAMGAVVGHEMTHAFDDKGRKYNYEGELLDWWTEEDSAEYEKRVKVMVDQASGFQVHGKPVQGKLTSGENIADLGGLRLALRALKSQPDFDPSAQIDGFTSIQRFFLAWAQCWRQNITEQRSLQLLTLDPHGPNELRCNGPLQNMSDFHDAFSAGPGSPMYREKETRVDIW